MSIALDTSFLIYVERLGFVPGDRPPRAPEDRHKVEIAEELLPRFARAGIVVPAQVLGELFTVLIRKAGRLPAEARSAVLAWRQIFGVQPTTETVLLDACDLAVAHGLQIWDAVIVAAAAEAGCEYLIAEDAAIRRIGIHRGVRMFDPFRDPMPPNLAARLG